MQRRQSTDTELWCGACKEMHPRSSFGRDRKTQSGLAHACKAVVSNRNKVAHSKARGANNARHIEARAARKAGPNSIDWAMKKLVSDARRRAESRGLPFAIDASTVPRPTHCPVFGFKLVYQATGKRLENSASLDRFDSKQGYTADNVWVISWRANQIKSDATPLELQILCAAIGKKAAGRLLDGVQHDGYPNAKGEE